MIDLVAGRIDLMFLNIGSAKAQIESGTLRGLAVSGPSRASTLPNVPTFREVGVPLPELDPGTWWGVAAPGGLPADVTQAQCRDAGAGGYRSARSLRGSTSIRRRARRRSSRHIRRDKEMGRRDQARQDNGGLKHFRLSALFLE
jgi:hypothetical protein